MPETKELKEAGTIRPCTANGIVYKAYKRPYSGGSAQVLSLFASCYYGDAPWEIFFVGVAGNPNKYQLMEKVPRIVYFIVSYYSAAFSSQAGLLDLGDTVTIVDAHGEHKVPVEALE